MSREVRTSPGGRCKETRDPTRTKDGGQPYEKMERKETGDKFEGLSRSLGIRRPALNPVYKGEKGSVEKRERAGEREEKMEKATSKNTRVNRPPPAQEPCGGAGRHVRGMAIIRRRRRRSQSWSEGVWMGTGGIWGVEAA